MLVDLPGHGGSLEVNECRDLPGVSDALDALVEQLDGSVHGVLGHSLGGKSLSNTRRVEPNLMNTFGSSTPDSGLSVDRVKASDAMRVMEMLRQ